MGFQSKMADLRCWVRFDGKMYDIRDPSTPEEIHNLQPLSLADVILYKLQSNGHIDVRTRISDETSGGNQKIESMKVADQPMFANFAELPSTSTKKTGATPTKARVSTSPISRKTNLKSTMELKTSKAGKRKAASRAMLRPPLSG
jgi:hypothetical protein